MKTQPTITVVHSLAHRRRLRLSEAPENVEQFLSHVRDHEGIGQLDFNSISRSLLVHFDPDKVHGEEIMMRIAVALSEQKGLVPVYLLPAPAQTRIPSEAWLSGAVLLGAYGLYYGAGRSQPRTAECLGGLATAAAVFEHARQEKQQQGTVDPEVWTLLYLLFALWRGRTLRAALITWLTVFGRHLTRYAQGVIEIKPRKAGPHRKDVSFEVVLRSGIASSDRVSVTGQLVQSIISIMGGQAARFVGELQQVVRLHDQVLHGLGRFQEGVPVQFS
jgi:hypothetical protein